MPSIHDIEKMQREVRTRSEQDASGPLATAREAIQLMLDAWSHVGAQQFDLRTGKGASRVIVWSYLCSMPSNALWCLGAAISGQAIAAGALLRVSIEEAIGVDYFGRFPEKALRQVYESPGKDTVGFDAKLDTLGYGPSTSLRRFYGELSNMYSHGNAIMRPEQVPNPEAEIPTVRGEPSYIPETTPFYCTMIRRCMAIALGSVVLHSFPELHTSHRAWGTEVTRLVASVSEIVPDE